MYSSERLKGIDECLGKDVICVIRVATRELVCVAMKAVPILSDQLVKESSPRSVGQRCEQLGTREP